MIEIFDDKYTFNVGNFGYYECEIIDCENNVVFEESNTFLGALDLKIDVKTSQGIIRSEVRIEEEEFKETKKTLIDKTSKVYFSQPELMSKISEIFGHIIQNAQDFVYIQDPYFDYRYYSALIEKLPLNLDIKIKYENNKNLNIPSNRKLTLIKDNKQNGKIHDRFIITKNFGYFIGISLNGLDTNKGSINYIYDTNELRKEFE